MAANMMPPAGMPMPMPVQQAAMTYQLGAPVKEYKATIVGNIAMAVLGLGLAIFLGFTATQSGGSSSASPILLIVALLFAGIGVFAIFKAVNVAGQRVYLFQQGIIIENKGQVQPFPWNQVAEVKQSITRHYRNGIYTGTTYQYTLSRIDGYQTKLDNSMKGIAELGQAVAQGVTRELLPRALNSIQAGQTLTFGPFSVHQQGIGNGREFIPWAQVDSVKVNNGQIHVKKIGQFFNWGNCGVPQMPNFFVFIALVEYMMRQAGRR